jgi:hypothetical protein
LIHRGITSAVPETVVNPVQKATLRKAAVWFAALLTLMQCGWIIIGGVLSLASVPNKVFLDFGRMGTRPVVGIILVAMVIGCAQVVAARTRSYVLPLLFGALTLGISLLAFFGALFDFSWAGIGLDTILVAIIPFIPAAIWLYTGAVMLWQALHLATDSPGLILRGITSAVPETVAIRVQKTTLRKAAVWFAALLTLMQCGWIIMGGVLSLASVPNQVFPDPGWMGTQMVIGELLLALMIGYAQILAVQSRGAALPLLLGILAALLGVVALPLVFVSVLAIFSVAGVNWDTVLNATMMFGVVVAWLYTGVAMLWHARALAVQQG